METETIVQAIILGFIEGLTEFIPVSSTGHILLAGEFLGFSSEGKVFEIVIQLGAILAIISVYFARLWNLFITLPSSASSRRFVAGIVLAFLPAAFAGVLLHGFIKEVLFETPILICISLIVGGFILLWIDRLPLTPRYTDVTEYPLSLCLKIGLCQMLALIPGTSRSGATIAGSLLMGTDKRSAAEFTFFLAMPTMFGAVVFDMYKNRDVLSADDLGLIAIGFVVAFFSALLVVRKLLDFVTSYGFAPFAYWRLFVGTVGLIGLYAAA
ncbi:MAG: undecaprenyl-diphosphate phosphatase [Pseudomonadota bacterium]